MNTLILVCKEGPSDRDRKRENPGGWRSAIYIIILSNFWAVTLWQDFGE